MKEPWKWTTGLVSLPEVRGQNNSGKPRRNQIRKQRIETYKRVSVIKLKCKYNTKDEMFRVRETFDLSRP